jgi:hypothetical protein
MSPFETILACVVALLMVGVIWVMTKHSIIVINRKDPAMATIKERLATLEAAVAAVPAPVDTSSFAKEADLTAVADRVTVIEAEIGTDPVPATAPVADPDPVTDPSQPAA